MTEKMISDAPERIWATVNGASTRLPDGGRQLIGGWSQDGDRPRTTEYVRADLVETLSARCGELERAQRPMRTGDVVYHRPSREEWVVAWADHGSGYMAPCGWPECQAMIIDCHLLQRATDAECQKLVADIKKSGRKDAHRAAFTAGAE